MCRGSFAIVYVPRRPPFDYGPLITSLKNAIDEKGLQPVPIFIKKNIELYEMICADSASVSELQVRVTVSVPRRRAARAHGRRADGRRQILQC